MILLYLTSHSHVKRFYIIIPIHANPCKKSKWLWISAMPLLSSFYPTSKCAELLNKHNFFFLFPFLTVTYVFCKSSSTIALAEGRFVYIGGGDTIAKGQSLMTEDEIL